MFRLNACVNLLVLDLRGLWRLRAAGFSCCCFWKFACLGVLLLVTLVFASVFVFECWFSCCLDLILCWLLRLITFAVFVLCDVCLV